MKNYLSNLQIIYQYTQPFGGFLDTQTTFLGNSVGDFSTSQPYMSWSQSFIGGYDVQIVSIDLQQAYLDGQLGINASIDCFADWYPADEGAINIKWIYGGVEYSQPVYPGIVSPTLVKTIELSAQEINPYNYLSDLEIIYSWPYGQLDLDTKTTFVDQSFGHGYQGYSPYVYFSQDNTGIGPEVVRIDLQQAYSDGKIGQRVIIPCSADWPQSKFKIINGSFTWSGAKVDAENKGGRLAVLNTLEKANQVPAANVNVWIGATDAASEGTWTWIDGSLVDSGYKNWGPGEPNNYPDPSAVPGEDYAYIIYTNNKWDDAINGANAYPYYVGGYVLELAQSGSGSAMLTWIYDGVEYSEGIYPNFASPAQTLVKNIEISFQKKSPYSNNVIEEFQPEFDLNTGDLSVTAIGRAVHSYKDVTFTFDITDRQLNTLTSASALRENPFVEAINIDILDISGNIIYDNYVTGSFSNVFTLTEAENTGIFGQYTKDFGIGISTVSSNASVHSSQYYVYANALEIESVSVTDSVGSWSNFSPLQNQSPYSDFPYKIKEYDVGFQYITGNALYFKDYSLIVSGYSGYVTGTIQTALTDIPTTLKIDWGDGLINNIPFVSNYSYDQNLALEEMIAPTGLNSSIYSFATGYSYPTGTTGIKNLKFYYSGSGNSGNQLIRTDQYRVPDELYPQGNPRIGDSLTGSINFSINFPNDPLYTVSSKLNIYKSDQSGVAVNTGNLISAIPILTNSTNYSFTVDEALVEANKPQWFKFSPYSEIETGYAWEVGPYTLYKAPQPPIEGVFDLLKIRDGDSDVLLTFETGYVPTTGSTIIDTIEKGERHTFEYLSQFVDASGMYCSSKIVIVDNSSGIDLSKTGISFSESNISDNSFVNYSVYDNSTGIYLTAQLNTPTGFYKLYKTSI